MKKISSYFAVETKNTESETSSADSASSSGSASANTTAIATNQSSISLDNLPEKPHQPKSLCFPTKDQGKQKRQFNPKWFDQFRFLHYQEGNDTVICHTCTLANNRNLLTIDTKKEKVFLETGFSNWKKAIEKFRAHENSTTHKHAIEVLTNPSQIDELLSPKTVAVQKKENSRCLMKLLENIVFLGKQGMALRGDEDEKSGPFYQLCLLRAKDDPALSKWIERTYDRHMSPAAQNDMLRLLALSVLRKVAADIRSSGCFSILADEASDVSNVEQLVICIRWVTKELAVEEDFIGLKPLEIANAESITSAIKDVILRLGLSMDDAKAQCYDGCSTMTGVRSGVATRIKQDNPECLLTHCYCHALNLAVGDTVKGVPILKEILDIAYELTKLVKYSPKRQAALKAKQEELKIDQINLPVDSCNSVTDGFSRLRMLCPTRWTVRAKALESILNNYVAIIEMLQWCTDPSNVSDSDIRARAGGIAIKMKTFNFIYGLRLSMLVLNHSDNLSATLQNPDLCASEAQKIANLVVQTLEKIRSDEHAHNFLECTKIEAGRLGINKPENSDLPRKRKQPRNLEDYGGYGQSEPHHSKTVEAFYRVQYFNAIDTVISTIKERFDQPDYQIYVNLEKTLVNGAMGKDIDETMSFLEKHYTKNFDFPQLKIQLESLSVSFQTVPDSSITEVVSHLKKLSYGQRILLNQVFKLAQYCLVMPASNATSERAFSSMRRIKTYLRNTMTQNRLNHTMCLSIHKEKLEVLDLKSVINEFIDTVDRRKTVFARM